MADGILSKLSDFNYQPYSSDGAILDPATELGDGVTVAGIYSGVYRQKTDFNSLMASDIEAPDEQEIDHEFPYIKKESRVYTRKFNEVNSSITQTASEIMLEVNGKIGESEAQSLIDQTLDGITLSVSNDQGSTTFELKSGGVSLDTETVDLHVKSVNVDGTITADAINLNTATITGALTAANIDASDLHVSGANIDNLTVTNAQIDTLSANKIVGAGMTGGQAGWGYIPAGAISSANHALDDINATNGTISHFLTNDITLAQTLTIPLQGGGLLEIGGTSIIYKGTAYNWPAILSGATGGAVFG